MLKEKITMVFDESELTRGYFITYSVNTVGDDGEIEQGFIRNGIIYSVSETHINLFDGEGNKRSINVEDYQSNKVSILGVRKNAI